MRILRFNENKMWYKSIPEMLSWLNDKSQKTWIWLDSETTGLKGPKIEQLTQLSAIATKYNTNTNEFEELDTFDEKIKLTDFSKKRGTDPSDNIKKVLSFNHYGSGAYKYKNESEILNAFFGWVKQFENPLYIAQNASFDMNMLSGRSNSKISHEVFDTKSLIQLYYLPTLQKLSETNDEYKMLVNKIGVSDRDNGLISSSMSKIGPALNISMTNYHDALTDCRLMKSMFKLIIDFLKEHKDIDITKYQLERINIKK